MSRIKITDIPYLTDISDDVIITTDAQRMTAVVKVGDIIDYIVEQAETRLNKLDSKND